MPRTVAGAGTERTDTAKQGQGTLVLTGATQSFVPANNARVALIITAPAAAIALSLGSAAAVLTQGILIPANTMFVLNGYSGAVQVIGTAAQVVAFAEI